MPIYEYRCGSCRRRVQVFFRSFSAVGSATCPNCQSTDLQRVPSRVAQVKSESSYEDFLSDPSNLENVDYDNPRAMAQWARRMGEAAGVEMDGEYEEMLGAMERGEDPEAFAGGDDAGGDFGGDFGGGDFGMDDSDF
jgi:putative FmdB family regulatory protein